MESQKIIETLYQTIENYGLMYAMKKHFGVGAKMQIPFFSETYNAEIDILNISVRSYNCLKRSGCKTINDVIVALQENSLPSIRHLGKKSLYDIRAAICNLGYNRLSETQKKNFIKSLYQTNIDKWGNYDRLE